MIAVNIPDSYYEAPEAEAVCPERDCEDGQIVGHDGTGAEVSEPCPNRFHADPADIRAEQGDILYKQMREDGF